MHGTLEDLKDLELCYSPIYSTARDVTNLSALVALADFYGISVDELICHTPKAPSSRT